MDADDETQLVADSEDHSDDDGEDSAREACSEEFLKDFLRIGITLIVLGCCSVASSIGTLLLTRWYSQRGNASSGIWCGMFCIATGSLAITARYFLNKGVLISNVVVTSLSFLFGIVNVICAAIVSFTYVWDSAFTVTLAAIQCALAIAWTTICMYHLVLTARILQFGVKSVTNCSVPCCPGSGMFPDPRYTLPVAYVPAPNGTANEQQRQAVFMAAPASGMSMT